MNEIIDAIILIILLLSAFFILRFLTKRTVLVVRLYSLARLTGGKIKLSSPLLPLIPRPRKGAITLKILDTVYTLRLYSGGGGTKSVHFLDRRYSVTYTRTAIGTVSHSRLRGKARLITSDTLNLGARVCVLDAPEENTEGAVEVMLFNPAPMEVSYVDDTGSSVKLAFAGDEMHGEKVFTLSSFISYAERRYREQLHAKKSASFF